jgi:hypothetical protein
MHQAPRSPALGLLAEFLRDPLLPRVDALGPRPVGEHRRHHHDQRRRSAPAPAPAAQVAALAPPYQPKYCHAWKKFMMKNAPPKLLNPRV